jgi:hypothetical protein
MAIGGYKEKPVLGGYHTVMILVKFIFHKVIYKRVWLSQKKHSKIYTPGKAINFFLN